MGHFLSLSESPNILYSPPIVVNFYTYYERRLPTPFGHNFSTIYTLISVYFTYSIYTIIVIYFGHSQHHR